MLKKEDQLIYYCFKAALLGCQPQQIATMLDSNINWDYFFDRARSQGVLSLTYEVLSRADFARVLIPRVQWERLENCYYRITKRNILLSENLCNILRLFRDKGIDVILLKGIALIHTVHQNIGLRMMNDIDILIKRDDLPIADNLLNSLGYRGLTDYRDNLKNYPSSPIKAINYLPNNSLRFAVHLHWHLINSSWPLDSLIRKIDMEKIWNAAQHVTIEDAQAAVLKPEHLLIYLAQHNLRDGFSRLILVYDLVKVMQHYKDNLDWVFLTREAEEFGLSFIVYCSLLLTSSLIGFDIPQLEKIKIGEANFFRKKFLSSIRRKKYSQRIAYLIYLDLQKSLSEKIRFLIKTIVPTPLVLADGFNLPASRIRPVHYCQRFAGNLYNLLRF